MLKFQPGDHVCIPCGMGLYSHHMIVLSNDENDGIEVLDYWVETEGQSGFNAFKSLRKVLPNHEPQDVDNSNAQGVLAIRTLNDDEFDKLIQVKYNCTWWDCCKAKGGTATVAKADPIEIVLKRIRFICDHQELIKPYSATKRNCETLACWCKTGTWATLQVLSAMVKIAGTTVLGGTVAYSTAVVALTTTTTTTVAAEGVMGWVGATKQVTRVVAPNPIILACIAFVTAMGLAITSIGAAAIVKEWSDLEKQLNAKFSSVKQAEDEDKFPLVV